MHFWRTWGFFGPTVNLMWKGLGKGKKLQNGGSLSAVRVLPANAWMTLRWAGFPERKEGHGGREAVRNHQRNRASPCVCSSIPRKHKDIFHHDAVLCLIICHSSKSFGTWVKWLMAYSAQNVGLIKKPKWYSCDLMWRSTKQRQAMLIVLCTKLLFSLPSFSQRMQHTRMPCHTHISMSLYPTPAKGQLCKTIFTLPHSCPVQNCSITYGPPLKPSGTKAIHRFSTEMMETNEIQFWHRVSWH